MPPTRKTTYLGSFGYNMNPQELGEPSGFWQFASYADLWQAFEASEALNLAFDTLGEPTYSRIVIATDDDGYILFHLLILDTQFISSEREAKVIEMAREWIQNR
jgi:hypothetical protein